MVVPEEKVLEVDKFAHEVAFELTNGTDMFTVHSPNGCIYGVLPSEAITSLYENISFNRYI